MTESCFHTLRRIKEPPYRYQCTKCSKKLKILSGMLLPDRPAHCSKKPLAGFRLIIHCFHSDATDVLKSPERLRELVGEKLDSKGLDEEVDYTLEVTRIHVR